jgi:hypothetical protein
MSSLLEALAQSIAKAEAEKSREPMGAKQQVAELREFFAARTVKHDFTPGQILRHKMPATATIKFADQPHIFLEYLEVPFDAAERAEFDDLDDTHVTNVYDCKVAVRTERFVVTFLSQSWMWEPHPDFTEATMN